MVFEGNIEANFLYEIVICSYLFPFSFKTSKAVLPIEQGRSGYRLVTRDEAVGKRSLLAQWLEKAETLWNEGRKEKNKFNIYQWIDHSRKLTRQNPNNPNKTFFSVCAYSELMPVTKKKQISHTDDGQQHSITEYGRKEPIKIELKEIKADET